MSKRIGTIVALLLSIFVVLAVVSHQAAAVQPSGYGRTTMANSMSVAIASDQTVPVSGTITATVDTSTLATAAAQATQLTALNLLTQPKSTTAVVKSDATDTTAYCGKGIWVGGGGDVAVKMLSDSAATTLLAVPSGSFIPGQFLRVMSTNTTATSIVCFGGTG